MSSILGGAGGSNGVGLLQGRSSIQGSLVVGGRSQSSSASASDDSVKNLITASQTTASQERAGRFLTLSNVKSATDIASDGIKAIADLRSEQLSLAAEIADSPYGERSESLSARITEIETEIDRVAESATYNGQNVLTQSTTFAADVSSEDSTNTVVLPSASSVIDVNLPTITSQEDALSVYTTLYDVNISTTQVKGSIENAQSKATEILETTLVTTKDDPNILTDIEEAEKVATNVASQIVSPFVTDEAKKSIIEATIGSLTSDQAQSLLNPE